MNNRHCVRRSELRPVRSRWLAALLPLFLLSIGHLAGCREYKPVLQELEGIEELKARFNKDAGKPRVVLLLSPT